MSCELVRTSVLPRISGELSSSHRPDSKEHAVRMLRSLVLLAGLVSLVGCQGLGGPSRVDQQSGPGSKQEVASSLDDDQMLMALRRANRDDAAELVAAVLQDALDKTYRYTNETRGAAFAAVADHGLLEVLPQVRELAGMAVPLLPPEQRKTDPKHGLDVISVTLAMWALVNLEDPEAKERSRARLSAREDPWILGAAIENLADLEDWDSSELVVEALSAADPVQIAGSLGDALRIVRMAGSPASTFCVELERIEAAFSGSVFSGSVPEPVAAEVAQLRAALSCRGPQASTPGA